MQGNREKLIGSRFAVPQSIEAHGTITVSIPVLSLTKYDVGELRREAAELVRKWARIKTLREQQNPVPVT